MRDVSTEAFDDINLQRASKANVIALVRDLAFVLLHALVDPRVVLVSTLVDQVKAQLIPAKHSQCAHIYQDSVIVGDDRVRSRILIFNARCFWVLFFFQCD